MRAAERVESRPIRRLLPADLPEAGGALRLRGEALLCVVLLIVGGMDEFDAAVDASERSIDVGHRAASRARCQLGALRGIGVGTAEKARSRRRAPWGRCGVTWGGRTGVRSGEDTPDRRNGRFQGR